MKVLMVTNEKGGPGKTTISCHVAGLLAARGQRVLLVDFDPQAHATLLFALPKSTALHDVLVGGRDILACITQPEGHRWALPGETPRGKLYVLPGGSSSWNIPMEVRDVARLGDCLAELRASIDVVVIDTAPTPGLMLTLVYAAADLALIPTKAEFLSLDGIINTVKAMESWPNVKLLAIQPNMYRDGTDLHRHHLAQLNEAAEVNGWTVWPPIAERIIWSEAASVQQLVYTLPATTGKARAEAISLVEHVERGLEQR